MKKEIVFIDEETLTKSELQNMNVKEQANTRLKMYCENWEEMNGPTKE